MDVTHNPKSLTAIIADLARKIAATNARADAATTAVVAVVATTSSTTVAQAEIVTMFKHPKMPTPNVLSPIKKIDVDTCLFQVKRYLIFFPKLLQTDGIIRNYLVRGMASTWWRYTQSAFQGNWENFKTAIKERWQSVNLQRVARDKIATLRQVGSKGRFYNKICRTPDMHTYHDTG